MLVTCRRVFYLLFPTPPSSFVGVTWATICNLGHYLVSDFICQFNEGQKEEYLIGTKRDEIIVIKFIMIQIYFFSYFLHNSVFLRHFYNLNILWWLETNLTYIIFYHWIAALDLKLLSFHDFLHLFSLSSWVYLLYTPCVLRLRYLRF